MTEFKTEIEKIIDDFATDISKYNYKKMHKEYTNTLIQLFNKLIEEKEKDILDYWGYGQYFDNNNLKQDEVIAQDIINILKIKE